MTDIRITTQRGKKVRLLLTSTGRRLRADRIVREFFAGERLRILALRYRCWTDDTEAAVRWYLSNPEALREALKGGCDD